MFEFNRRRVMQGMAAAGLLLSASPIRAQDRNAIVEGARREGQMALATSISLTEFPKVLAAFKEKYPFLDVNKGLYQAATGTVLSRVEAEMNARALSFDVLHIASLAPYLNYARTGRLEAYQSPELAAYPADTYDPKYMWATARAIGVVIAYNKNTLSEDKAPKSWVDLLKPEFKGRRIIIQTSAAGTTFNQLYALEKILGEKVLGPDYLKKLGDQQLVQAGSAQMTDMLVRGEALIGAGLDQTVAFQPSTIRNGIVSVYPTEGMPVATAPIAVLKNAPHPNAAKLFVDFILSKEGQQLFAIDLFQVYSVRKDIAPPQGQRPIDQTKPLIATNLDEYEKYAADYVERFDGYFRR
jgi:iron(III) transport system substrate-binding protein